MQYDIETCFDAHSKKWFAVLVDSKGQLKGQYAETKELAIFKLGIEYNKNPQSFARPLSEILASDEVA